jgi:hypothetical protein
MSRIVKLLKFGPHVVMVYYSNICKLPRVIWKWYVYFCKVVRSQFEDHLKIFRANDLLEICYNIVFLKLWVLNIFLWSFMFSTLVWIELLIFQLYEFDHPRIVIRYYFNVEIVENWKSLGYFYKCTMHDVFCIFILQLLKF